MTDRRFEYSHEVLRCCAQSNLASFVISSDSTTDNGTKSNDQLSLRFQSDRAETATQQQYEQQQQQQLSSSSSSSLRNSISGTNRHDILNILDGDREPEKRKAGGSDDSDDDHDYQNDVGDHCCQLLFVQHAEHYGRARQHSNPQMKLLYERYRGWLTGDAVQYRVDRTLETFIRNAVYVYRHASTYERPWDLRERHQIALNRFADQEFDTILPNRDLKDDTDMDGAHHRSLRTLLNIEEDEAKQSQVQITTIPLVDTASIIKAGADLRIGHGSYKTLNSKGKKKKKLYKNLPSSTMRVPMDRQSEFQTPNVDAPENAGALLSIKRNVEYDQNTSGANNDHEAAGESNQKVIDANEEDDFETHLNWATSSNPDGVPIVNDAFDQGTCGACWAFAAAGSLEASAARREAYITYHDEIDGYTYQDNATLSKSIRNQAIADAQAQEAKSFAILNLSVQELIDCDSAADQGCTGGNPLLAFYFIHRYGLTSWDNYPYVGYEDICHKKLVRSPIVSVKSWGIVSPNHENHMELVLRYIGPIAVGINGAHPSFLAYSGGIFDSAHCKQAANHALLIVGYGQERDVDGTIIKYWIARNSWGKGWGENGFVRIARREGSKGIAGVCGIARSPSVALGGFLLARESMSSLGARSGNGAVQAGTVEQLEYTFIERICIFTRSDLDGNCGHFANWVDTHHALIAAIVGTSLALSSIFFLSRDWRRRRRIRRLREERRRLDALQPTEVNESSKLLPAEPAATYNTERPS